jgi:tetratricopeptide (TPR) repeat protein
MLPTITQRYNFLTSAALVVVTLLVYLPVRTHEFVRYDDDVYVTNNPDVQSGLTAQNIKWAFTTGYASNWHPLTWLSHQLDCALFDGNSAAHHSVNVLFHIANTVLLLIILNRITKRPAVSIVEPFWPSAFVAALFALHPLHVESVAWVAERKDVLSTFFWFLTMLAYTRYAEKPSVFRYIVTLVLFALGLMSKPMLVTLPFVLLLLDYWPLDRIRNLKKAVIEKVPFFILAAISSIITYAVQQKGGAMVAVPLNERLANAVCSYLAYIGKMFWPINLAVLYPYPAAGISASKVVLCAIVLILITILIIYFGRRHKYFIFGWLWFIGTLVPVIGIIQVGSQSLADRYTYVPLIGLFIIIAFAAADLFPKIASRKIVLAALAGVILLACTITTSIQLRYWKNSLTLFEHTLAVTENNNVILNNYANILNSLGRSAQAVEYLEKAAKARPNSPQIRNNLGEALKKLGLPDKAIEQYQTALKLDSSFDVARFNIGVALFDKGDYDAAIEQFKIYIGPDVNLAQDTAIMPGKDRFQNILHLKPDAGNAFSHIGFALARKGNPAEAVRYYNIALQFDPNDVISHGRLALALATLGRIDEAIDQCRIVLKARPDDAEMHSNLGILLESKGQIEQASESYKKAVKIDPNSTKARDRLDALTQKNPQK